MRRTQFSLKTMLWLTAVVAVGAAYMRCAFWMEATNSLSKIHLDASPMLVVLVAAVGLFWFVRQRSAPDR